MATEVSESKKGDVVLIKEDNLPSSLWLYVLVKESHPGHDGIVRVVKLRKKFCY